MALHGDKGVNVRIVNFCDSALPTENVLTFDTTDVGQMVEKIRTYADLPYVYCLPKEKEALAADLLNELKSIRSTCYPHALFVEGAGGEVRPDPALVYR